MIGFDAAKIGRITMAHALALLTTVCACSEQSPIEQRLPEQEEVGAPDAPTGPATALADSLIAWTAGGAESSFGHEVEYRFDFDDSRQTEWSTVPVVTNRYPSPGQFDVRAQARCAQHPEVISEWSEAHSLQARVEQVSTPIKPTGVTDLCPSAGSTYSTSGATSDVGHPIEYQFDWGDGLSYWLDLGSSEHAWAVEGTYGCRSRARCKLDPTVVSEWSPAVGVAIESHPTPWLLEFELPELVGTYVDEATGSKVSRTADVVYSGPRAIIKRLKVDYTGRGRGTSCSFDYPPGTPDYDLHMILWFNVRTLGKEMIWDPLGIFLGRPARDFTSFDYWGYEGGSSWVSPKIIEPGDTLRVFMYAGLEGAPGCRPGRYAFCEVYDASLSLEVECAWE